MRNELDAIRDLLPPVSDDPAAIDRARADLMTFIDNGLAARRPWWKRQRIVAVGIAALVTAGAAWVVGNIAMSTSVGCHVPNNGIAIVDSETGDPVVDCGRIWRTDYGIPPPPLVAYDNGMGGIEVVPQSEDAPSGWSELEPGVVQDVRLIELEEALDDVVVGLQASCYDFASAERIVSRELERLALGEWAIDAQADSADPTTCSYFYLDPSRRRVVLIDLGAPFDVPDEDVVAFGLQLHEALSGECLALAEAETIVRDLAAEAGLGAIHPDLVLRTVLDDSMGCTRGHVALTASVRVTLRGPGG